MTVEWVEEGDGRWMTELDGGVVVSVSQGRAGTPWDIYVEGPDEWGNDDSWFLGTERYLDDALVTAEARIDGGLGRARQVHSGGRE